MRILEFLGLFQKCKQHVPLPRGAKAFVVLRRTVPVTAHDEVVQCARFQHIGQNTVVSMLPVRADFDVADGETLSTGDIQQFGHPWVQKWFSKIEQPEETDDLHVDVTQASVKVLDRNETDFGFERGIGAAYATQLTPVHDIEMELVDFEP